MKKFFQYIAIPVMLVAMFSPVLTQAELIQIPGTIIEVTTTDPGEEAGCGFLSWTKLGQCVKSAVLGALGALSYLILRIFALILWISGVFLNEILKYTIVDMSTHINGGVVDGQLVAGMTGINVAWKVIRDLMNIGFIFLLLYEAIKVIIGISSTAAVRKFIVGIVMASILINFSLFFTKVLIDASNVLTVGIYNSILVSTEQGFNAGGGTIYRLGGLSVPFMRALGITSFFGTEGIDMLYDASSGDGTNFIIMNSAGSILFLIVAFVFFAIAILFLIRYVALIILMMLSPIAYMGLAFTGMRSYSNQWWEAFKSQLLFAPIYMLITWVILTLMSSPGFIISSDSSWASLIIGNSSSGIRTSDAGSISLIINFLVIIALAIASLLISKSTATKGSTLIGAATGKVSAFAGGAIFGGAAALGRQSLGRWGTSQANNEQLKEKIAKGEATIKERLQFAASSKAASSSFDVRATKPFGQLEKSTGFKFTGGKIDTKKQNFKAIQEEKAKQEAKFAESLKPSDAEKEKAEATLKSSDFQAEELERKLQRENWIKSDEYKNSAEYKKREETENSIRKDNLDANRMQASIDSSQKDIDKLNAEIASTTDEARKSELGATVRKMQTESSGARIEMTKIRNRIKENREALEKMDLDEKLWMSEEKKKLVALSGGQKELKDDKTKEIIQQKVDSAFKERVEAYAQTIERESGMWKWAKNIGAGAAAGTAVGGPGGTVLGGATGAVYKVIKSGAPKSKAQAEVLARKVRSLNKEKSTSEKTKDLLKQLKKEAETSGEKFELEEEEEKAPTTEEKSEEPTTEPSSGSTT